MSWWKKNKKCPICLKKYPKNKPFHELRLQTAEGLETIEICEPCADFFDKSAEAIVNAHRREKPTDQTEDQEV